MRFEAATYEAMQLGSVPVYISDRHVLSWADELDWEEFCVIVDAGQLADLDRALTRIDDQRHRHMLQRARDIYETYFTLAGVAANIVNRIT